MTKLYFGTKLVADETLPLSELPKDERLRLFNEYLKLVAEQRCDEDAAFHDKTVAPKLSRYIYPFKEPIFAQLDGVADELERLKILLTLDYTQNRELVDYMLAYGFDEAMKLYLQEDSPFVANVTKLMQIFFYKGCNVRHWVRDEVHEILAPYHLELLREYRGQKVPIQVYFERAYNDYKYKLPIKQRRLKFSTHVLTQLLSYFYPESIDPESYMSLGPGSKIGVLNLLNLESASDKKLNALAIELFNEVRGLPDYPVDAYHYSTFECQVCYAFNGDIRYNKDIYKGKYYAYKLNLANESRNN